VKFLNGYRGKLTRERFYQVGDVAELEDTAAQRLIHQGVAEQVQPDPEPEAPALPRRSKRTGDA
jgi:hypothetical protein